MKIYCMSHQNTQCEVLKDISEPNIQNEAFASSPTLLCPNFIAVKRVSKTAVMFGSRIVRFQP